MTKIINHFEPIRSHTTYPNSAPTIPLLQEAGYGVVVRHHNKVATSVTLTHPHTGDTAIGVACVHEGDQFDRKKGRTIALGRAWKQVCQLRGGTIADRIRGVVSRAHNRNLLSTKLNGLLLHPDAHRLTDEAKARSAEVARDCHREAIFDAEEVASLHARYPEAARAVANHPSAR